MVRVGVEVADVPVADQFFSGVVGYGKVYYGVVSSGIEECGCGSFVGPGEPKRGKEIK